MSGDPSGEAGHSGHGRGLSAGETRRRLLGAAAGLASPLPALTGAVIVAAPGSAAAQATSLDLRPAVLPLKEDDTVAPGYARDLLIRWGDRVTADAPPWNPRQPNAAAAETQFGWDGRIVDIVPVPAAADAVPRALLAVAHPTVDPAMAFPGGVDRPAVAAAMQGASLLNIERQGDRWLVVDGGYQSRRLTANTLCRVSGPAAGGLGGAVRGLLNVTGGCTTPWGTLLLTEGEPRGWLTRLQGWEGRFADPLGFGWMVELDPMDPGAVPVKRTALGRFPHGDAVAALTRDGRAVVYMSDHRAAGHLMRFTSHGPARGTDALDRGVLAVAVLEGERLRWADLPDGADALLDPSALAGRQGAPPPFDLPSGLALGPNGGRLTLACRGQPGGGEPGGSAGGRPRAGGVLQVMPAGGDHGADTALLRPLLTGGYPGRFSPIGTTWPEHPDTVVLDGNGRAWIGTDRGGRIGGAPDGLFGCDTEGPGRGLPLPLYGAPRGAAVGGSALSPDGTALFAVVRTPGAEPGASWDRPGTRWPGFDGNQPPRTALVAFSRLRGGPVGGA
ncbi:PhoX family protein [Muricoccus radiodurans]|uniref:PhoX family protein n=1 Tax=Muricoccus radiodurans TaxID=2231721 RepID=UPI003CE94DF2